MPVRSLSSSVLRWPDAEVVDRAVRHWAQEIAHKRPGIIRIGYFGSYASGDWGWGVTSTSLLWWSEPSFRP